MSIALNATGKVLALNADLLMIHGSSFARNAANPLNRMTTYGDDLHHPLSQVRPTYVPGAPEYGRLGGLALHG